MNKQHIGSLLRLVLSVVLIVALFSVIDRQHFIDNLRSVDPLIFLLGLAAYFGATALWALRWHLFIRAVGEQVSFVRVFFTTTVGMFFSLFLPTMVGSDLGRMYELSREQHDKVGVVSTVLLDRLMGLVTLALMAVFALFFGAEFAGSVPVKEIVIGTAVIMSVGWVLFFNRRVMRRFNWIFDLPVVKRLEPTLRELYNSLHFLQSQPRLLLLTFGLSMIYQAVHVLSVVLVAWALGVRVEPVYYFVFMPIIWLVTMVPISISGLGLREGAFAFFFTQVGMTGAEAVAISLLYYGYNVAVGVVGGLVFSRTALVNYRRRLAEPAAAGVETTGQIS